MIFPIQDAEGTTIAFGGRLLLTNNRTSNLPTDKKYRTPAKYVNSPNTAVYRKSQHVYGLEVAKEHITKQDKCILVEGYFDVVSLHECGIRNVVAALGTAISMEQIELAASYAPSKVSDVRIILCHLLTIYLSLESGFALG